MDYPYPWCLEQVIYSVIQQYVEEYSKSVDCLGPFICDFFKIEHPACCEKRSKHSKSRKLCRRCGRSLKRHILECSMNSLDIYTERRCCMKTQLRASIGCSRIHYNHCMRFRWNDKVSWLTTCPKHTCDHCIDEACKDLETLVWGILCFKRLGFCKDLIPLMAKMLRPSFCVTYGKKHLDKYYLTLSFEKIDSFTSKEIVMHLSNGNVIN